MESLFRAEEPTPEASPINLHCRPPLPSSPEPSNSATELQSAHRTPSTSSDGTLLVSEAPDGEQSLLGDGDSGSEVSYDSDIETAAWFKEGSAAEQAGGWFDGTVSSAGTAGANDLLWSGAPAPANTDTTRLHPTLVPKPSFGAANEHWAASSRDDAGNSTSWPPKNLFASLVWPSENSPTRFPDLRPYWKARLSVRWAKLHSSCWGENAKEEKD
jgi:hypothetical protein